MFVSTILLTLTLVIVRARNLNTEIVKDHVPVPKYDFSSHEFDFAENGEHEELSSDGFHDHGHRGFRGHGSFNVEFNRRQFRLSENEKRNERDSQSSMPGPALSRGGLHDFIMVTFSNIDREQSSRGKKHKERTNHTTQSTDSDFGLETFNNETKIRDSNVEELNNVERRHKTKSFQSNHGVEHDNSEFGFGNFEERINKRINENNNMQRRKFQSNFFNSRSEFNDRKPEEQNTKQFGVQIQDNEKYFDSLASSHNQKSQDNDEKRHQKQKNRLNTELRTTSNFNNISNSSIQHKEKEDNLRRSSTGNIEMDQRPIFQTSAKPAVIDSKKETNGDQWVWSEGNDGKPPASNITSTEIPATTPDVDDRAAFNGDKCPTGSIRIGNICAPVD